MGGGSDAPLADLSPLFRGEKKKWGGRGGIMPWDLHSALSHPVRKLKGFSIRERSSKK
jgi:hypothetical protein